MPRTEYRIRKVSADTYCVQLIVAEVFAILVEERPHGLIQEREYFRCCKCHWVRIATSNTKTNRAHLKLISSAGWQQPVRPAELPAPAISVFIQICSGTHFTGFWMSAGKYPCPADSGGNICHVCRRSAYGLMHRTRCVWWMLKKVL